MHMKHHPIGGVVELFNIREYNINLISKKSLELGIISIDSLSSNVKVIEGIEKSLFERHDKELKVNQIKIVFSERNNKIRL